MSREQISHSNDGEAVESEVSGSPDATGQPDGFRLPPALREQFHRAFAPGVIPAVIGVLTIIETIKPRPPL
jgi:hypothetical protein